MSRRNGQLKHGDKVRGVRHHNCEGVMLAYNVSDSLAAEDPCLCTEVAGKVGTVTEVYGHIKRASWGPAEGFKFVVVTFPAGRVRYVVKV